jgi:2-oxoisovalerate ferredoxin oxidoreductase gamma subunit
VKNLKEAGRMIEIRFHGRGGQGAVTAANILASAAFKEGKYVQAFPFFGVERRGAPVTAFTRIDDKPIRIKTQIYEPDIVVVLDPSLLDTVDVTAGLKEGGIVIINTEKSKEEVLEKLKRKPAKLALVDATGIALEVLGLPITNTAILGAVAKATGLVKLESVQEAIKETFSGTLGEKNAKAAEEAFNKTTLYEL